MNPPRIINPLTSEAAERFGRTIDRLPPAGGSGGGGGSFDGDWPFKLVAVSDTEVKVLLGTINGLVPSGIATPIDVSGTDGTWAIYMHGTISGTTFSAPQVVDDDGGTVPSDTSTDTYRLIGEVDVDGGVITEVRPSMAWSQNVTICTPDSPPYAWTTGA